jgi:hypothetical protein
MAAKKQDGRDFIEVVLRLAAAAEEYVNRSPKVTRLEAQRTVLLDAIGDVQLQLSVRQLPPVTAREPAGKLHRAEQTAALEVELKRSQTLLKELDRRLRPLTARLGEVSAQVNDVKASLEQALEKPSQDRAA